MELRQEGVAGSMKKVNMRRSETFVYIAAILFALLAGVGQLRGCPVPVAPAEAAEVKRRLLREAELERVHHEVHAKVGEEVWEYEVKPAFLGPSPGGRCTIRA
jgi:hypothetical protein